MQFWLWPRYYVICPCLIWTVIAAEVATGTGCYDYVAPLLPQYVCPAVNSQLNIRLISTLVSSRKGRGVKQLCWQEEGDEDDIEGRKCVYTSGFGMIPL